MMHVIALLVTSLASVSAQSALYEAEKSTFNSSFHVTSEQAQAAGLSSSEVNNLNLAIEFERSQLVNGGPLQDDFYKLPPLVNGSIPEAGVLLKVQQYTNTTPYSLASNLALSRILYTTTNLNGTVIPASAFVLWPFTPRRFANSTGAPVALWTHGTSGFFANGGPSAFRNLWYDYSSVYTLALSGYAVVAPDFAGLGISKSWDNSSIPHQYLASPAGAHDGLYALKAAHKAFPGLLDDRFVTIGHSEGGGVAWGVAELVHQDPELGSGYLGTVAGSPVTVFDSGDPATLVATYVAAGASSIFPSFRPADWLTPAGVARLDLAKSIQAGTSSALVLASTTAGNGGSLVRADFRQSWYTQAYGKLGNAGGRAFAGPLLVVQGTNDPYVSYNVTSATVQRTVAAASGSDLEYLVVNGTGHVPTLHASQQVWLRWIEDRFEGHPVKAGGYKRTELHSFRPIADYQATGNSFIQWAGADKYTYETPLGL